MIKKLLIILILLSVTACGATLDNMESIMTDDPASLAQLSCGIIVTYCAVTAESWCIPAAATCNNLDAFFNPQMSSHQQNKKLREIKKYERKIK